MIRFDAFFDERFGFYRARFWGDGVDTERKVPEAFWRELGHAVPRSPDPRFDLLAARWAAGESERIPGELRSSRAAQEMTWLECASLMQRENPNLIAEASADQNARWTATIRHFLESTGQVDITPSEIDIVLATRFRNWRKEEIGYHDRAPRWRTVRNELGHIRRVCRFALDWSRVTGCTSIRLHRIPQTIHEDSGQVALTEEEFSKALNIADEETAQILGQGVTTMLRKSNLLGLRGEWFDPVERWMTIEASLMKGRRNQKRTLSVPVSRWSLELLNGRSGYVFPNPATGKPYKSVDQRLQTLSNDAGIRAFSLHDLRTTGNSWLARRGVPEVARMALLNHSTNMTTTQLYTKAFTDHLRESVAIFDAIRSENGW